MSYLTKDELEALGFKSLGKNVKISSKAAIYNHECIEIGNNSRIDDFCVISGKVRIGSNVHITPQCLIAGGEMGVEINDFVALAYGVKVFSQSDDYSGASMCNSTVPAKYKNEYKAKVVIGRHSIIGAGSIVMPGVTINEGVSVGAASLVKFATEPWSIYVGVPAVKKKNRKKDILDLEKQFLFDRKVNK